MTFIDTAALLARYLKNDQHHGAALRYWQELGARRSQLFTSNFVLDETLTLLARRAGARFALARLRTVYHSPSFVILRPDAADELSALELFEKYADQSVSFTDCVSFALMLRLGPGEVFTFDRHFRRAGFEVRP